MAAGFYLAARCFIGVSAKVVDQTVFTLEILGLADITPMQQKPVVGVHHVFRRDDFHQSLFNFQHVFGPGQARSGSTRGRYAYRLPSSSD